MLVAINFGEENNKPNENIKNLSTKNDFSDLLVKMGFKQNDAGVIMLLDDEKAKKSFFISKTVKQKDKESEADEKTLYLKSSVLVQALMCNIIYKYSEQLKQDDELRKSLKETFDSLIKRINNLYDNMHGQDAYDKSVYSGEVDNDIDKYNALSVDSDTVLNYLLAQCILDIFLEVGFKSNNDAIGVELDNCRAELKQYLNDVWKVMDKNKSGNLGNTELGYLLIDEKTNPSKNLDDVHNVFWNKSKLFLEFRQVHVEESALFNPLSAQRYDQYDDGIFKNSGYACLGMGRRYKNCLKETKDNFESVIYLCSYYIENYYNNYNEKKFGESELKKCLYDRKAAYLDHLLELIMKENKYSKEQINTGINNFGLKSRQKSNDRINTINLLLEYIFDSGYTMIINSPSGYTGNYTYNSVLKNLDRFMKKNEDGDLQFKNEEAQKEFKNLNIEPNIGRTVLFSNAEFESDDSKKKYLPQFLSFVPTKELLKTQNPTDKIYLMDFDRLNDIKDSDKFQFDDYAEHDYKDIVKKIAKEACGKCQNEEVKNKTFEFEKIFEHMKLMFMDDKIVFREDNKEVMKYFFQFLVEKQNEYQSRVSKFGLSQYDPCVSCLGFMPELYGKYKDSKHCDCIKSIAEYIFEFTLEKLEKSRINVNQIVKAMIKYKENFGISVNNMEQIKTWMKERLYEFSESSFVLYCGKSIDQITSHELMEALFEFKNWQQIIDTNRSYFLRHAGNVMAELDKDKEENKKLIENIEKIQWLPDNGVNDEEFRKCVQGVLAVFDKNDAAKIGPLLIKDCFDTKQETVEKQKYIKGAKRKISYNRTVLKYDNKKIKIFTEETVKKFIGSSEINKLICDSMFNSSQQKLLTYIDLDLIILNSDKIERVMEYINRFITNNSEDEIRITFGPKAFAHIVNIISKEKSPKKREEAIQDIFNKKSIHYRDLICDSVFHNDITDKDEMPEQDENYGIIMQEAVLISLNTKGYEDQKACAEHVLCDFLKMQTGISLDFIKQICPLRSGDAYYSFEFISIVMDKLGDRIDYNCLNLLLFSGQEWGKFFGSYNNTRNDTKEVYQKSFKDMVIKVVDWCFKNGISEDKITKLFERFSGTKTEINKIIADKKKQILESKTGKNAAINNSEAKETKLNKKENSLDNKSENNNNDIKEQNKNGDKQVQNVIDNKNDNPINSQNQSKETNMNNQSKEKNNNISDLQSDNLKDKQVDNVASNKPEAKVTNESKLSTKKNGLYNKDKNHNNNDDIHEEKIDLENKPNTTKEKNNNNNDGQSEVISSNQKENTESSSKQKENINDNYGEKIKIDSRDRLNMEGDANKKSNINTIDLNINENEPKNEDKQEENSKLKIQVNGKQDINLKIDNKNINMGIGIGTNNNKINDIIPKKIPTPYANLNNQLSNQFETQRNINHGNDLKGNPQVTQANNKFFTLDVYLCIFAILALCVSAVFIKLLILAFIALPGGYMICKGFKCKQFNGQKKLAESNLQVGGPIGQNNNNNNLNDVTENLSKPGQAVVYGKDNKQNIKNSLIK